MKRQAPDEEGKVASADAEHASRVPGELLCLEVSETTVMTDPELAVTTLRQIRAMGVRVALDDYGTGYSSMTHLRVLPVDELKIDQSFVHHLSRGDQHNAVLVRSMIQLGHDLGLVVVAEGVEEARVMVGLKKLGCDVVQGYHVSRPLTAAGLHAWQLHPAACRHGHCHRVLRLSAGHPADQRSRGTADRGTFPHRVIAAAPCHCERS